LVSHAAAGGYYARGNCGNVVSDVAAVEVIGGRIVVADMDVLKFFDAYTALAKQLFEALAGTHQLTRPKKYGDKPHCYIWADDILRTWRHVSFEIISLNKRWDWYCHGPHCLFTCLDDNDNTEIEGNWYNYNIVDSGFFAQFLLTNPLAKKSTSGLEINFHTVTDMLEQCAQNGHLHQLKGSVDFIRAEHKHTL